MITLEQIGLMALLACVFMVVGVVFLAASHLIEDEDEDGTV